MQVEKIIHSGPNTSPRLGVLAQHRRRTARMSQADVYFVTVSSEKEHAHHRDCPSKARQPAKSGERETPHPIRQQDTNLRAAPRAHAGTLNSGLSDGAVQDGYRFFPLVKSSASA